MSRAVHLIIMGLASTFGATAHSFCFDEAGAQYNVNPALLKGIAKVESSMNPAAINKSHFERTKSIDIGLMQINSGWLKTLKKNNITQESLLDDACLNVKVGAWILSNTMAREGASWNGVGAYNAVCVQLKGEACENARMTYANKVWRAMNAKSTTKDQQLALHVQPKGSQIASVEVASRSVESEQ